MHSLRTSLGKWLSGNCLLSLFLGPNINAHLVFSTGLMEQWKMCTQPPALINWVHFLIFFPPLILKTGARLALELHATLRSLDLSRERWVLAQYRIDHRLPLRSELINSWASPTPQVEESLKSSFSVPPCAHQDARRVGRWGAGESPFPLSYSLPNLLPSPLVGGALNSARMATEEQSNPLARCQVKGALRLLGPDWDHRAIY